MLKLRVFCVLLLVFTIVMLSSGQNYCSICKNHSSCIYRSKKPVCNARSYGFTKEMQKKIVKLHNKYRCKVASGKEKRGKPGPQPRAKSMPKLVWDQELANVAQNWANQCRYGHDSCRNVQRFRVGQNIARGGQGNSSLMAKLLLFVKLWYEEVRQFNYKRVEKYISGGKVGHYTQMLWAKTTKIGCGYTNYRNGTKYDIYLVCNYGPAGNILGKPMYEYRR